MQAILIRVLQDPILSICPPYIGQEGSSTRQYARRHLAIFFKSLCTLFHGVALVVGTLMHRCSQLDGTGLLPVHCGKRCVLQLLRRHAAFDGVRKKRAQYSNAGTRCQRSVSEPAVANSSNGSRPACRIATSVTELIGNTPMVYLNRGSFPHYVDEAKFSCDGVWPL